MLSIRLLVNAISLTSALAESFVLPINKGAPYSPNALDLTGTDTDASTIADTIAVVEQKATTQPDAVPEQPVPDTVISAIDGVLTGADVVNVTIASTSWRSTTAKRRRSVTAADFQEVFTGTGITAEARDCAIEGTSYLTYKLVSNATYSKDDCLSFCASVDGCVFANLYYEFNNPLLDYVFSEKSNLKCALFGDVHPATEKTNCGGQRQQPEPAGLTYMQQSSGYALASLVDPATPDGYEPVFGPTGGANNAPGYMGFVLLSQYDVGECARQCEIRNADAKGGACQYFNIWRALVDNKPQSYTCAMYYLPTDESTAVNYGQGNLKVTYSRGYRRVSALTDGGFESYTCPDGPGDNFCFTETTSYWKGQSANRGNLDATFFHYLPYAHSGLSVALLGSASGSDALAGTITPASVLSTVPGAKYEIQFFHDSSFYEANLMFGAFVEVIWNDKVVLTLSPGWQQWTYYAVTVTAKGDDKLEFRGGKYPAYSFIDDVNVFAVSS